MAAWTKKVWGWRRVALALAAVWAAGCVGPRVGGESGRLGRSRDTRPVAGERRIDLWPVHFKRTAHEQVRRVWPIAGTRTVGDDMYGFAAWPLVHWWHDSDEDRSGTLVLPLFYYSAAERDSDDRCLISPLAVRWWDTEDDEAHWLFPPLLSAYTSGLRDRRVDALLGLVHEEWGGVERRGYAFPLYTYRGSRHVLTPLFGWDTEKDRGFVYPLTPLVGIHKGSYSGSWLFPVYSYERYRPTGRRTGRFLLWGRYWSDGRYSGSHFFPLYLYRNTGDVRLGAASDETYADYGRELYMLPCCWYRNQLRLRPDQPPGEDPVGVLKVSDRRNGIFPLWSYTRLECPRRKALDVHTMALLALYDYRRTVRPSTDVPDGLSETSVSSVLWRVWRYERATGDLGEGAEREWSILWRLFRYASGPNATKVDVLFVPVWRSRT